MWIHWMYKRYHIQIVCGKWKHLNIFIPHATNLGGWVYWIHHVCLSVCPLTFRVRPEASTVQDGFFPYLVQMINSMRGCVACDYLRPWPISSRSFGLDLENRVRSVAFTALDGFVIFLAQMIAIIRECVACYVFFRIWKIEFLKADLWYFIDDSPKKLLYKHFLWSTAKIHCNRITTLFSIISHDFNYRF